MYDITTNHFYLILTQRRLVSNGDDLLCAEVAISAFHLLSSNIVTFFG